MPFEMVERDERLSRCERQALCRHQPHHDAADQPGPRGCGDRIHLVQPHAGFRQHILHQSGQDLDMRARRDLGHDAAERPVRALLPGELVRQDPPVGRDQSRRRFVAARFDAEDKAHRRLPCHWRPSTTICTGPLAPPAKRR